MDASATISRSSPNTVETVRKNFAGAFGFLIVPTDSEGHATQTQLVPDSITRWEGSSFCLSDVEGFGFTKYPANLTTFLPFFGEITLPFSIIRGEIVVMRAAVSNYFENRCIKVHVELQQSDDYEATPVDDNQEDRTLQSGQKSYYFWNIDAKSLGKVEFTFSAETTFIGESCDGESDPTIQPHKDTVIQNLLIKPEGIPQESTTTYLVCVEDSTSNLQFSISVPENAVVDSIKASATFVGDFLSLTWKNIENLLRMPSGCCEQKLARMAPIPYLLNYMNTTHQLTDELLQKGTEYLIQGRNQMFRCRNYDGSYGVFWGSVYNGNSWLTASAYKTFAKSSGYISIDKTQQEQTMIWLSNTQDLESGCFIPQGNLFTVGAVENPSVLFTAHMSITLLETNDSLIGIVMQGGALRCLRSAINENSNGLYTQSFILRAMTLAQDWENRDILLEQIKGKAISEDGTLHWELDDISIVRSFYYCRYYPSELEIAANILLSILDGPVFTDDDLIYSTKIALWLSRQFNSRGGFCSSQDTVAVLQALSLFATKIFQPNSHHDITVNDGSEDIIAVTLNQDNRLLVQTYPLPHIPGNYSAQVTGLGCCLIQATTEYNIIVPETGSAFDVSAVTTSPQCTNGAADIIAVNITMSYNGPYNDSGMVIIDFRCFSGYTDDYTSLYEVIY
ncbi:ovostatin-like [Pelobates cultripes]|uniref:Ovostatin-like, partial n=1 Tax=Pelobates cultripes TaxID=61616 RepID=A0AAD1TBS3_PELCU|nr:ovostatin-like [Pelobates cultripes]